MALIMEKLNNMDSGRNWQMLKAKPSKEMLKIMADYEREDMQEDDQWDIWI